MTNELFRIAAPIVVLTAGILGFAAFGQKAEPPQKESAGEPAPTVETVQVDRCEEKISIEFDGVVVPYRRVRVAAEVAGRVTQKARILKAGRYVKQPLASPAGELADNESNDEPPQYLEREGRNYLIEIDPRNYRSEVDRLSAEIKYLNQVLAELEKELQATDRLVEIAKSQYGLEESEFERAELLKKRGVITDSEMVNYKRSMLTAESTWKNLEKQKIQLQQNLVQTQQSLTSTSETLEQAELDEQRSRISAPIDGLVVEDYVEQGDYVQRGTDLFLLEDISKVEISSNLTMEELSWLLQTPDVSAEGTLPAGDETAHQLSQIPVYVYYNLAGNIIRWDGKISRLAGTGVDPRTRTIPCRVTVDRPREFDVLDSRLNPLDDAEQQTSRSPRTLMNGMFVEMKAGVDPAQAVLTLPESAVRPGNVVWKYTSDNKLQMVTIDVLHRQGENVLILAENSPFAEGDEVITSPLSNPRDGMLLRKKSETGKNENTAEVAP